ncbi:hypothetical protein [Pontibacter akesuensis]|uniref:Uncharacterized protein n=1 Tax=Pontibacter akesuensis TaxID=388950 RepID=A0A1I7KFM7_9BACT|nr:hypothetical protein [Pontibacter akesuensis]GHA79520.1 hypothetical protein GCM10007389_37130 [Pontibacter akesuensis]SFU96257.1 hypothetical protein SAMN04487941_3675 [Pontibacter akesuensis]
MSIKDVVNSIKKEIKVVQGEETKDKLYQNHNEFQTEAEAREAFERSKAKLFDVNMWTKIGGVNSTFYLYDDRGHRTTAKMPEIGYYIKIILPGSDLENWVRVTAVREEENLAEFVVHPSEQPSELGEGDAKIEHFFIKEASSTFRVTREGNKLSAFEIGRNEGINNHGEEAGDRAVLNTLVAEGGWAGFQEMQWDNLTRYLVHLEEAKEV